MMVKIFGINNSDEMTLSIHDCEEGAEQALEFFKFIYPENVFTIEKLILNKLPLQHLSHLKEE